MAGINDSIGLFSEHWRRSNGTDPKLHHAYPFRRYPPTFLFAYIKICKKISMNSDKYLITSSDMRIATIKTHKNIVYLL